MLVDFDMKGQKGKEFFPGWSIIMDLYFDQKQQFKVKTP